MEEQLITFTLVDAFGYFTDNPTTVSLKAITDFLTLKNMKKDSSVLIAYAAMHTVKKRNELEHLTSFPYQTVKFLTEIEEPEELTPDTIRFGFKKAIYDLMCKYELKKIKSLVEGGEPRPLDLAPVFHDLTRLPALPVDPKDYLLASEHPFYPLLVTCRHYVANLCDHYNEKDLYVHIEKLCNVLFPSTQKNPMLQTFRLSIYCWVAMEFLSRGISSPHISTYILEYIQALEIPEKKAFYLNIAISYLLQDVSNPRLFKDLYSCLHILESQDDKKLFLKRVEPVLYRHIAIFSPGSQDKLDALRMVDLSEIDAENVSFIAKLFFELQLHLTQEHRLNPTDGTLENLQICTCYRYILNLQKDINERKGDPIKLYDSCIGQLKEKARLSSTKKVEIHAKPPSAYEAAIAILEAKKQAYLEKTDPKEDFLIKP